MKKIITALFALCCTVAFAQTDLKEEFKLFTIQSKKLGKVEFCTFRTGIDQKKPLMVFVHGSGNLPNFHYRKDWKGYGWTAFSVLQKYKEKYHILFVSKPTIPLFDTVSVNPTNHEVEYPSSDEYHEKYSLEWRAESASLIIEEAIKRLPVDKSKIVLVGHSQGGQVVPKVAVLNKKVTHVVVLNANSLNHLYDFVLQERMAAFKGEQSFEDTQKNIETLFADYKEIFADPNNRTKFWSNETYFRWASFSDETPLENMLKLKIPIFVIAGGKDIWGSFIMNTDYVEIEFLRHRKTNLRYKVYPNANHFLQNEIIENGKTKSVDIKHEVFEDIMKWIDEKEK